MAAQHIKYVPGKNKGKIMLYALSTCIWCKKTKNLLNELGVEYSYIDVDLLEGEEKERIKKEIEKWNPAGSFPTLVINVEECVNGFVETKEGECHPYKHAINVEKCIIGYKEKEIRDLLK